MVREMGKEHKFIRMEINMSGNWLQGIRSGKGSQKYLNGDNYVGNWEKGERNGFGIYTDSKGNIFEGNWKNNLKNGEWNPCLQ